jgi:hypothetical protein
VEETILPHSQKTEGSEPSGVVGHEAQLPELSVEETILPHS